MKNNIEVLKKMKEYSSKYEEKSIDDIDDVKVGDIFSCSAIDEEGRYVTFHTIQIVGEKLYLLECNENGILKDVDLKDEEDINWILEDFDSLNEYNNARLKEVIEEYMLIQSNKL